MKLGGWNWKQKNQNLRRKEEFEETGLRGGVSSVANVREMLWTKHSQAKWITKSKIGATILR